MPTHSVLAITNMSPHTLRSAKSMCSSSKWTLLENVIPPCSWWVQIHTVTVCSRGYLGVHRCPISTHIVHIRWLFVCIVHSSRRPVHLGWSKHCTQCGLHDVTRKATITTRDSHLHANCIDTRDWDQNLLLVLLSWSLQKTALITWFSL